MCYNFAGLALKERSDALKKPFIAVIGARNSGKSTIIKSLTGCPQASYRGFVKDRVIKKTIYVSACSPQEKTLTQQGITQEVKELQRIIQKTEKNNACLGIVMAIQPDGQRPRRERLSMKKIFETVPKKTFRTYAFVLDPGYPNQKASKSLFEEVERQLKEANIQALSCKLDARRFAFNNAMEINCRARLL